MIVDPVVSVNRPLNMLIHYYVLTNNDNSCSLTWKQLTLAGSVVFACNGRSEQLANSFDHTIHNYRKQHTIYKIQDTLFKVGLHTETLAQWAQLSM